MVLQIDGEWRLASRVLSRQRGCIQLPLPMLTCPVGLRLLVRVTGNPGCQQITGTFYAVLG